MNTRREIPQVGRVLDALGPTVLPRPVVAALVRRELAALRRGKSVPPFESVVANVEAAVREHARTRLQPVINATGVVIHTNLGRAPMGRPTAAILESVATQYCNLEFDLRTGARGGRAAYGEQHLARLCGAGAVLVVNNCAAALVLLLRHFTAGAAREVLISRGELVQIGGGFRIPEILEATGAVLREVGTTNRTTAEDYARAASPRTALLLRVHRSNFFMDGFVETPGVESLARLARRRRWPFVVDLGSGAMVPTDGFPGLEREPTPSEVLRQGATLVCFSGDKLLGGPQAGIIAGGARPVAALRREPLYRALRCDKLVLAALQSTVDLHLGMAGGGSNGSDDIPTLALLRTKVGDLRDRARHIQAECAQSAADIRVIDSQARVGGGTLPRSSMPSVALEIAPRSMTAAALAVRLRLGTPPVVGQVVGGRLRLDLRTVFPSQDRALASALRSAWAPAEA
jgi:L-seryl-tRNA(Ser) seleniumtransferase